MYRNLVALAFACALASCTGGNPLTDDEGVAVGNPLLDEDEVPDETETGNGDGDDASNVFGSDLNADLTVNEMSFDPATGELVLNNMPFDGDDNIYTRDDTISDAIGSEFDVYRNASGPASYYAVFRLSDTGYSQVGTAGTESYVSFGYGGAAAQRLSGSGALPNDQQTYVFTGEYAAVRTVIDSEDGSTMQYVAGTATLRVDTEDFDETGVIGGYIADRSFFDANGVQITDLDGVGDFITLKDSDINFDNWTISSADATVYTDNGTTAGATGSWDGLFAGPNGEEIAGVVVVEGTGPIGIDPDTGNYVEVDVRETGGFIATR
ncbi:hypothetical protein [Pelagimonas varians]|uniref:Transferrin-binding protein B C-lobe/N-lobe beta barrel domain-containing protein n=1 Tax=Pelagimonas varians TaxID=696760 RepID=A0A238K0V5_9RHOB|nr:hypothetical protein [Pelagimonas varians]PYG33072.1 hypothetical protein C8N36_10266 [Pelagimonas varians]SMX35596.1 hypothetical protein PEV8663_00528 [Pelagimonas varians]